MQLDHRDYNEEAHKLFQHLGLSVSGAATEGSSQRGRYRNLDAVWQHPTSGGRAFIGNQTAASSRQILSENGITHVVNCTTDMPLYFQSTSDPISYLRFDIYRFYRELDLKSHRGVLEFFTPVFRWIDEAVGAGHGVLIHCLAGAHRAGTTGIAYAMHAADLDHRSAIAACQAIRPVVDPIHELRTLLALLEVARAASAGAPTIARTAAAVLNAADGGTVAELLAGDVVSSDNSSTPELLLQLPFVCPVLRLEAVHLRAPDAESAPPHARLFANQPNLDIDDASGGVAPTQDIVALAWTPEPGSATLCASIKLHPGRFQDLSCLALHLTRDEEDGAPVAVCGVRLEGKV